MLDLLQECSRRWEAVGGGEFLFGALFLTGDWRGEPEKKCKKKQT